MSSLHRRTLTPETCIRGRPRIGETCSGDVGFVSTVEAVTWVMLVDALGHGPLAAEVAVVAVDEAEQFTATLSLEQALNRLHARMHGSRGAAIALLRFEAHTLGFVGVGNVELRTLSGTAVPFMANRGVLGARLPRNLRLGEIELSEPGSLLLYTDGISRGTPLNAMASLAPDVLCDTLIAKYSIERDDATVLHVRYSDPPT